MTPQKNFNPLKRITCMEIVQELRDYIRTPKDGPYKGHFLVAYKRSGNTCLYKHRHYSKKIVYGYYLFELQEGNDSDNLPSVFKYYKSHQAARRKYKALVEGEVEVKGVTTIPQYFEEEINNKKFTQLQRVGNVCLYEVRYLRSNRVYEYHVFNIKLDRKGNERYPYFYHRNINIISSLNRAKIKFNVIVRHVETCKAMIEDEKAKEEMHIAKLKAIKESIQKSKKETARLARLSSKSTIKINERKL